MFRLTLKSLWSHKRRLISTCISVILGVAFMAGTFVLTSTINNAFDDLFATGYEGTDVVVRGPELYKNAQEGGTQRDLLPESAIAKVRAVPGVAAAEGNIFTTFITVLDHKGDPMGGQGPPTIVSGWRSDPKLNPYQVVDGRAPASPKEAVIDRAAADKGKLELGKKLVLETSKGQRRLTLVGITQFGDADSSGGVIDVQTTLAGAQALIGEPGKVNSVYARGEAGTKARDLAGKVRDAKVAPKANVITGEQAAADDSQELKGGFVSFFSVILLVFAAIALFVGAFIISNTFGILVAQRTKELALLRAIGATRRQVLTSVLLEAGVIGIFSSLLGLIAGVGVAAGALAALSAFGVDLPNAGITLEPTSALITLLVGLGITAIASIMPAVRATRVPPIAALRSVAIDTAGRSIVRPVIGALILALGVASILPAFGEDPSSDILPGVGSGLGLIIISVLVLAPSFARPLSFLVGSPLPAVGGITGRISRQNAMRSPRRTASTASALIIGVTLIVFITAFAASAQTSISNAISGGFRGDYIIQPKSQGQPTPVDPKLAKQLAGVDGVEVVAAAAFLGAQLTLPNGSKPGDFIAGIDPATYTEVFDIKMEEGKLTDLGDGEIIVDRQIVKKHELKMGQKIKVLVGAGGRTATFRIVGVSDDPILLGNWTITNADAAKLSATPSIAFAGIKLKDGVKVDGIRPELKKIVAAYPTVKLQNQDEFTGSIVDSIKVLLNVIYGLLGMSVLISLIGIANTLSLSIHERTRELGLLRAMGMTRSQVRTSIRWEAAIVAVMGTVIGVLLGIMGGYTMVRALVSKGFTDFELPIVGGLSLTTIIVIALLLGVFAAERPARRAARLNVLDAISSE